MAETNSFKGIFDDEIEGGIKSYDLVAIVNHSGGLLGGHYVSYCKNNVNSEWYLYDDSHVSQISENYVENSEAYILFYQKKVTESKLKERLETEQHVNTHTHIERPFYVSKYWWTKFLCMSHPGPINNSDYLCQHSQIKLKFYSDERNEPIEHQFLRLSPKIWDYLVATYGGDQAIRKLIKCKECERDHLALESQRKKDRDAEEEDRHYLLPTEKWYLISTKWIEKWREFVDGSPQLPGPISNEDLLIEGSNQPKPGLRRIIHYKGLTPGIWKYLKETYGGGPDIKRRQLDIYESKERINESNNIESKPKAEEKE
eukprot:TRINITY_DN5751_c0_g1_i2.p1 TRINITY_DN5751_c0_g1~~TRINITY_DN5751_c0_g1_i2.p1  ORF type:complete len:315 (+),score=104.13 TRINITY_DN5751_c0_g1_i2:634-1578(+)